MVYDKFPERSQLMKANGVEGSEKVVIADSVKQIAAENDVIFTMLFNTQTSEEVYRGTGGVFDNAKEKAILIDSKLRSDFDSQ
jgi:3-hydroxyisobutyrate dehydrogenase-like beta-hydroxyacid dehydrogenase